MAIKLLIGGSPCTHWSIAQTKDRETEPQGLGWELFLNYVIAKEKFKPDFFLYENNKSAAQPIKDQIAKVLGVGTDPQARFTYINSALVSAQNRQRFYVTNFGDIEQPEDRGILLKDILEDCVADREKAHTLKHQAGNARDYFKKHHTQIKFEPVAVAQRGRYAESGNRHAKIEGQTVQYYEARQDSKANALTTVTKDCMVGVPIRVGSLPLENGELSAHNSKQYRIYGTYGTSTTLCGNGGGMGAKTGLYAIPVNETADGKAQCLRASCYKYGIRNMIGNEVDRKTCVAEHCPCYAKPIEWNEQGEPIKAISGADGKAYTVYKVESGVITIKGNAYPIKLADGYWIIRKLTVTECCRLQTLPDDYCKCVSPSQGYKIIGNGWTAEVIIHLLNHALKDVPRDEEIIVLSMYDGGGTGRYCLNQMGFTNVKYYAYEIDKYAMQVANDNFPGIIQCGDAFQVRNADWKL